MGEPFRGGNVDSGALTATLWVFLLGNNKFGALVGNATDQGEEENGNLEQEEVLSEFMGAPFSPNDA
jgi:hypothetical protein